MMKIRHVLALSTIAIFTASTLTGCGKIKLPFGKKNAATPEPAPAAAPAAPAPATPAPTAAAPAPAPQAPKPTAAAPEPTAPAPAPAAPTAAATHVVDRNAQVVVICYHRLEGKKGGALSIEPELFEKHMQELKDKGIPVISMQNFMAWRRGEKNIPPRAALLTIDDGYVSGLEVGVPVLKKYGYPATFFIYTNYVNVGGKSMSWAQLGQIRDEGFEIGSHTVSHQDLRKKPAKAKFPDYDSWLKDEVDTSKRLLEENLGIRVSTIAYPYGFHNPKVEAATQSAGYDLAFTTYGQRVGIAASPYTIGRYDVTAKDAQGHDGFTAAISFDGPAAPSGPITAVDAQAVMVTEPMNGAVINNPTPTLQANLASFGAINPSTIKMRVAGVGLVPAEFDPKTKNIKYAVAQPLRPGNVTVIISAMDGNRPVETKWTFSFDPKAKPSSPDAGTDLPPRR